MEELKLLVEMVAGLPAMTVWVLAGYLVYKLAVIGSIYGLIKFIVLHLYKWLTRQEVNIVHTIAGRVLNEKLAVKLEAELASLLGVSSGSTMYYHEQDVQWLLNAIAEKHARDKEKA